MITRPRHIAHCDFQPVPGKPGHVLSAPLGPFPHSVRLVVDIDAREYPLSDLCRYAHLRDPGGPSTFTNLEFAPVPPGMRVGPWPGWRGIPEFPTTTVTWGDMARDGAVQWWGDEFDCGVLRAMVWFPPECSGAIGCTVADPRLHPLGVRVIEDAPVRSVPHAVRLLPSIREAHPRLLITRDGLASLRIRAGSTHSLHMQRIRALLEASALPAEVTPESKAPSGPERVRPEDRAVLSALVALVEPSVASADDALAALRAFVAETRRPDFEPWGIDTQSGEMLFLLCLLYDWMYDLIPEPGRQELRAWLWTAAERVREHLSPGRTDLAQAHYLGCGLGLLAFACLFHDEHPKGEAWLAECRGSLDTILAMLPDDGFHPHGTNLWIYEYGFLLRWVEIIRLCTGEDLWQLPHWKNASAFRAATMSPDGRCGVTFGDPQYLVGGDAWCHYLIAARTGSGRAKAVGDALVNRSHEGIDFRSVPPRRRVYEFLFDEPSVIAEGVAPLLEHFEDGGQVAVRTGTDRSGLFTFRAGPPLGASRYRAGERGGYGHADPSTGAFLWYADGAFLASGPGPVYRRDSSLHNIVTINGCGQIGDSTVWVPDFFPPECLSPRPEVTEHGDVVSLSVDLAHAYLPHLGVRRCLRSLLIDPAHERIVGIDVVTCHSRANIEWNLHSHARFSLRDIHGVASWSATTGRRTMTAFLLDPDGGEATTGVSEFVPAYPNDGARGYFLRWSHTGTHMRLVWCLSLAHEPVPPAVRIYDGAVDLQFSDGVRVYFDGTRKVQEVGL